MYMFIFLYFADVTYTVAKKNAQKESVKKKTLYGHGNRLNVSFKHNFFLSCAYYFFAFIYCLKFVCFFVFVVKKKSFVKSFNCN